MPVIWVTHMKTTIEIADPLLKGAKRLAAQRKSTLKAVIEDALRDILDKADRPVVQEIRTHTFKGRGLQPGLSWDDWSRIRDMGYEGRGG